LADPAASPMMPPNPLCGHLENPVRRFRLSPLDSGPCVLLASPTYGHQHAPDHRRADSPPGRGRVLLQQAPVRPKRREFCPGVRFSRAGPSGQPDTPGVDRQALGGRARTRPADELSFAKTRRQAIASPACSARPTI
jgi:hypothetical protein